MGKIRGIKGRRMARRCLHYAQKMLRRGAESKVSWTVFCNLVSTSNLSHKVAKARRFASSALYLKSQTEHSASA